MNRASISVVSGDRAMGRTPPAALKPSLCCTLALLCGCLATGVVPADGLTLLRLAGAWLVADALLGTILAQLLTIKRCTTSGTLLGHAGGDPSMVSAVPVQTIIPYTVPGSPAARFVGRMEQTIARCRSETGALALRSGIMALVSTGMGLILATYLGRQTLAAVAAGLFLAAVLMVVVRTSVPLLERWGEGLHVAVAWVVGYVSLAPMHGVALGLALLAGLSALAWGRLQRHRDRRGRWLLAAVWATWVVVLLITRQPVIAASVAILGLAQQMIMTPSLSGSDGGAATHPWRSVQGYLNWYLALVLVALAARYWG